MDDLLRIGEVHELVFIEAVVLLCRDIVLVSLPQRHHRVERLGLDDGLIFRLGIFIRMFFLDTFLLLDLHADRIADVIGILADQALDLILRQELIVVFFLCVVLEI